MSTDEAVKVAVRVRPFNKREIARNAQIPVFSDFLTKTHLNVISSSYECSDTFSLYDNYKAEGILVLYFHLRNAKMIVEMSGASTKISNPEVTIVSTCQKHDLKPQPSILSSRESC